MQVTDGSEQPVTPTYLAYPHAAQSEIVRAHQKDVYYRDQFFTQLKEVVGDLLGSRRSQLYAEALSVVASVAYFGLSTLGGAQSLGEEYVNAMMRYRPSGKIISVKVRFYGDTYDSVAHFSLHYISLHHMCSSEPMAPCVCISCVKTKKLRSTNNERKCGLE